MAPSVNAEGYSEAGSEPASIIDRTECVLLCTPSWMQGLNMCLT